MKKNKYHIAYYNFVKKFNFISIVTIPGIMIVSFSNFLIELFGQVIPSIFSSFFRDVGVVIIVGATLLFIAVWFVKVRPHQSKNYSLVCFDVFGKELIMEGIRTEFKTNDVAWSFMKEYKKMYPLYNFALVTETIHSERETIIKYI